MASGRKTAPRNALAARMPAEKRSLKKRKRATLTGRRAQSVELIGA
jgi:hypothetical protein